MSWVPIGENHASLLTKVCMGQSRGILWVMYCIIFTMIISN